MVAQADLQMRSVEWNIVAEELNVAGKSKPWDDVMLATAFGNVVGPRAHWWWTHVVGPLSKGTTRGAAATSVVEGLEQRPGSSGPIAPMGHGKKQKAVKAVATLSRPHEICFPWNDGGCSSPCPNGRQHRCRHCNTTGHRGKDCPQRSEKNKGKGYGKGRKGGNGNADNKANGGEGDQGGRKRKRGGRGAKAPTK